MIVKEDLGNGMIRTYSDLGVQIEREGVQYSEAIDPAGLEREYTETDFPVKIGIETMAEMKAYTDSKIRELIGQYQANQAALLSLMPLETQAEMIQNDTDNILFQEGI